MIRLIAASLLAASLTACMHQSTEAGAPESAGRLVSRGYDCGLKPDRSRIAGRFRGEERARFVAASQAAAVRSYNRPSGCGEWERQAVSTALRAMRP